MNSDILQGELSVINSFKYIFHRKEKIPKELVGKFRYYSECMSAHYNIFITNEFP